MAAAFCGSGAESGGLVHKTHGSVHLVAALTTRAAAAASLHAALSQEVVGAQRRRMNWRGGRHRSMLAISASQESEAANQMHHRATPNATAAKMGLRTTGLDGWMLGNPWHPRIFPFVAYIACLPLIKEARQWSLLTYPVLYTIQCGLVTYLLWRYRRLLPELNLRFHWLAVPIVLALAALWIGLGWLMAGEWNLRWPAITAGQPLGAIDYEAARLEPGTFADPKPHYFTEFMSSLPALAWTSIALRLLGMSLVVPLFEELFIRSALLRGLRSARQTAIGVLQIIGDLPLIGEWIMHTRLGTKAATKAPAFTKQLVETPLGTLTLFGVCASTFVFMMHHLKRDWPGTIACGLLWCFLVWWTNRPGHDEAKKLGLGPVVWSHGITNAALGTYCVYTGDWQFL